MMRKLWPGLLLWVFVSVSGCISLPREAVQLSAEMGANVSESRVAHLSLVRKYMEQMPHWHRRSLH